jgi:protease I
MAGKLDGKRIAILATDGVEQVELTEPRDVVTREGARTELISLSDGEIQAMNGDITPADRFPVDRTAAEASPSDYDALILPGGTVNADRLRMDPDVQGFVKEIVRAGRPVGVICHGPWTLIDAGVVSGRRLTSYPSLRTDLRNAGADVVDSEVVTDRGLVSSRNPGDLPAFCAAIVEEFAAQRQAARGEGATVS